LAREKKEPLTYSKRKPKKNKKAEPSVDIGNGRAGFLGKEKANWKEKRQ